MQYVMKTRQSSPSPPLTYPRLLVGLSLIFPSLPSVSFMRKKDDSRKRLDFSLFGILLHGHSFTLSLGICFWIPSRLNHQHINRA
jgi:hypothetical protein